MRSSQSFPGACNIQPYFQGLCEKKTLRKEHGQPRVVRICLQGDKCDFLAHVYNCLSIKFKEQSVAPRVA